MNTQHGFTLAELMIVVAIIGILAAFAIPAYNGFISESQRGAARANLENLRLAVENYGVENNGVITALNNVQWTPCATTAEGCCATCTLKNTLRWVPNGDKGLYTYVITTQACASAAVLGANACYHLSVSYSGVEQASFTKDIVI